MSTYRLNTAETPGSKRKQEEARGSKRKPIITVTIGFLYGMARKRNA
jgi:hypothetical protein